jgi:hypothetical protein
MHRKLLVCALAAGLAAGVFPGTGTALGASPCGRMSRAPGWRHVVVIAFENHSYNQILGRGAPPSEFTKLASECGSATAYRAVHFPRSLPNYLGATSGTVPTTADCLPGPECSTGAGNIFSQLGPRNWRTLAESMPRPCDTANTSLYVPRHAPAVYYTRVPRSVCRRNVVGLPGGRFRLRREFTWIVPNLRHDMHDGTPAQASSWLHTFLEGRNGLLRRAPYTRGRTAVFIWFDSAGASGSVRTPIPFIVISPSTPARRITRPLDHFSSLRAWEGMLGLACWHAACDAPGLRLAFRL